MKKFLVVTAILMLSMAGTGCRMREWFNKGAPCNTCGPNDAYMAAPNTSMSVPSDGGYLPGPSG